MKKLVVYYSKTGHTKKIAEQIKKDIKADLEEVKDLKKRSGVVGWIKGGRDAMKKKTTEIVKERDPSKYDLVVIGTPIWAWTMTPAIRTYMQDHKFKRVAFFCTYGGNMKKTFSDMEEISKKPVATLDIIDKELETEDTTKRVKEFCKKLKKVIDGN